jgi:phenylpyruvate tautomerase PptA (4-oxalocrotonate tautomerase family)
MPLYTAITQDPLSDEIKTRIAEEVARIHSEVMKVPNSFVHMIFLSYQRGSGFSAGKEGSAASLSCVLRSGHTNEEKSGLLRKLWPMFQSLSAVATDQLVVSLQEIPASNAMEMGKIMHAVGLE